MIVSQIVSAQQAGSRLTLSRVCEASFTEISLR